MLKNATNIAISSSEVKRWRGSGGEVISVERMLSTNFIHPNPRAIFSVAIGAQQKSNNRF
ncbi:hypothetical protein NIES2104_13910 [Leptolyngbya sp. NIES-2104]|nr:hypothetical protein NIES2104_13910 [Leptolyngbya sp. NIES-2104]